MSSDDEFPQSTPQNVEEDLFLVEPEPAGDFLDNLTENPNEEPSEEPQAEGEGEDNNQESRTVKPKKIVRNPQPRLNEERLKDKRGITALKSHFERVRFKGKGHEEKDLNVILKTYEYWCHRMFPKSPFDECIAKIEKLGSKRGVMTHIKKIRMDLNDEDIGPITNLPYDSADSDDGNDSLEDSTPVEITEEQREMIRLSRERAERLRQERLARSQRNNDFDSLRTETTQETNVSTPQEVTAETYVDIAEEMTTNEEILEETTQETNVSTPQEVTSQTDVDTIEETTTNEEIPEETTRTTDESSQEVPTESTMFMEETENEA